MKKVLWVAACAVAVLSTSALAQDAYDDSTRDNDGTIRDDVKDVKEDVKDAKREAKDDAYDAKEQAKADLKSAKRRGRSWTEPPSKVGMELQVGGGGQSFLDGDATAVAKPGGDWTARLVVGTRSFIAGEAAYIGSAQNLDTLGVSDNAVLMSNGFEGALRVNFTRSVVQPYILGGYAFRRYTVTNTSVNTSSVAEADNVNAIPVGAGIAFRPGRFVIDVRAMFHGAFGQELIPNANLSTLAGQAKLGFEF
ncbi:MAG TPA: hypothetical protein VGE37_06590 [Archangium sp.]